MVTTIDLVSYYKLDETAGTTVNDAHGSTDGKNNGATVNQPGILDKAYDFESGDSDYIDDLPLLSGDTSFSINMWIKVESLTANRSLFYHRDSTDGGIAIRSLRVNTNGTIRYQLRDDSNTDLVSTNTTATVSTGSWAMVTFTFNTSTNAVKCYINAGTPSTDTFTGGVITPNRATIGINAFDLSSEPFDGLVDEVGIWERELSSTEISELYNSGDALAYPFAEELIASFYAEPLSGIIPLETEFTDTSEGTPTSWLWTFGDGGTSTEQNPTYEYSTVGCYTVSLTATNATGSDEEIKTNYIKANPSPSTIVYEPCSVGQTCIATRYPIEEGLDARTTKQTGNPNLIAKEKGAF